MKKLKLIMAVLAAFVCLNLVFAVKPEKEKNDDLATLVIEKLNKDVQLTDSQKIILKEKFNVFVGKMENANKKSNEKDKFNSKETASDEFEMVLDSILTINQKEQLNIKVAERGKVKK